MGACVDITGGCGNETKQEAVSPDGRFRAVVFDRNCGATVDYSREVSVLPASAAVPNGEAPADTGNVLRTARQPDVNVRWLDARTLEVRYAARARSPSRGAGIIGVVLQFIPDSTAEP
jgi:hypothetical protein